MRANNKLTDSRNGARASGVQPGGSFFDRFPSANRPAQLIEALRRLGTIGAAFESFAQTLLTHGHLAPALRELVILRVAFLRRSQYVYGGHALIARDVGLTFPPLAGEWPAEEALAVEVTDRLLAGDLDDETRRRATRTFGRLRLLELALVAGQYSLLSMVVAALGLQPEPGAAGLPDLWPGPDCHADSPRGQ